jgi:atypical dual specificity phosphatase
MSNWLKARLLFAPTFAWNFLLGRVLRVRRWWDEVDPAVLLGALPLPADAEKLAKIGVTGVVNLCEEYAGPHQAYRQLGIEQLHLPTIDFTPPTLADVENAVKFIQTKLADGGKVYVHCKAGRGRSATVVACWLIAARGLNRHQAQSALRQCRPHVSPLIDRRPVVIEFESRFAPPESLNHPPPSPP